MDSTGLDILSKLVRLGQRKQVCLQWISSHGGVPENEAADELAGRGCDLPNPSSTVLTHAEIHSFQRNKMNLTWRNPPAHHWYAAKIPGLSIQCRSSRAHQTALARLRSGHQRSMTFVLGVKSFFTCPCSLLASPAHLLDCWGIVLRQLYEEQGLASVLGHHDLSTAVVNFVMWRCPVRLVPHVQRRNDRGTCAASRSSGRIRCKKIRYVLPSKELGRRFVEWAQNEIAVVPDFHKRIFFSDEAPFWLNGYVNKQNCRIWSEANPQVYVETPLHPEKLTVWCALWAGGIIGPYFFKNDEGHNGTVNGDRYRAMITNFFIPELNNHDVQELWFQQDGATCHTARATIDLLKDMFGDRLISRFGPVNWPPRSCDLTPLDYFLWGYVKSLVYADKPQTLDHLKDNIRRVIADIRPQMLEKVIEIWTSRLDYIRASRGSHMPEIIFKM
ncbi:uncharacterized protein TNCV_1629441 [Trichonephila clavipes]|uniref:RNase H type-1 domain-containing protein n=1 Tax=Trichonephila clavipes TaxID=2585209 RepID=A0A8X6WBA0_TRICX|nr:uncharacterized protein TNCV_1629441 [Trichonephila clavipes]